MSKPYQRPAIATVFEVVVIFIFAEASKMVGLAVSPAAVGLALFVYTMDVLVAFLQAYIFTMLTALFVGGAVHPH